MSFRSPRNVIVVTMGPAPFRSRLPILHEYRIRSQARRGRSHRDLSLVTLSSGKERDREGTRGDHDAATRKVLGKAQAKTLRRIHSKRRSRRFESTHLHQKAQFRDPKWDLLKITKQC